jgi:hypothetical protein
MHMGDGANSLLIRHRLGFSSTIQKKTRQGIMCARQDTIALSPPPQLISQHIWDG